MARCLATDNQLHTSYYRYGNTALYKQHLIWKMTNSNKGMNLGGGQCHAYLYSVNLYNSQQHTQDEDAVKYVACCGCPINDTDVTNAFS